MGNLQILMWTILFINPGNIYIFDKTARSDHKLPYAILAMCGFMKVRMSVSNEMCKTIFQTSKLELTKAEEPPPSLLLALIFCLSLFVSFIRM